jgi:hypothetical protein
MDGWGTLINRNGDQLEGTFVQDRLEGEASVLPNTIEGKTMWPPA